MSNAETWKRACSEEREQKFEFVGIHQHHNILAVLREILSTNCGFKSYILNRIRMFLHYQ